MYTPGYDIENATKPKITLKIEETDPGMTGDQYAKGLLRGVQNGDFHISPDLLGNIFRASMRGVAPSGNFMVDSLWNFIGWVRFIIPFNSIIYCRCSIIACLGWSPDMAHVR